MLLASSGCPAHPTKTGEFIMFANSELANRFFAAFGALAITTGLLVASFAPPAATIATTMLV